MSKITLTYKDILFNNGFWQKVAHTPVKDNASFFYTGKLTEEAGVLQKKLGKVVKSTFKELAKKYGVEDAAKPGTYLYDRTGTPQCRPECEEAFETELENFANQEVQLNAEKLPFKHFSHISFTPYEFSILEKISDISADTIENEATDKKSNVTDIMASMN